METQVTTIATEYYTSAIDVFDVELMLNQAILPAAYERIYVTLVVLHEERWKQEAYEINGDLYVTLIINPSELFGKDVSILAKDKLITFLQTALIEKREPAPLV